MDKKEIAYHCHCQTIVMNQEKLSKISTKYLK